MEEGSDDQWVWDTDFTLADILPQIQSTSNSPAQMEECSARDVESGEAIDWVLIHSPVNGLIVDGAPEAAAVGTMTSVRRTTDVRIHCIVILDPVVEGASNPTVISAPYKLIINYDVDSC